MSIKYVAPATVSAFMQSAAFSRFILGPVGSGKSTGCMFEIIRRMQEQAPAPDGKRYTRWVIVRQTLKQIKETALKEFDTWVQPLCHFKVSENTLHFRFNDVVSEVILIPLDDENDQRRLLSMQITGAWINEFPEVDPNLIPAIAGRCGRYPSAAQGGASWFGIIADGNFPTEGGDWHRLFEYNRPPDWDLFKQPGGTHPDAENLNWLTQTPETLKLPVDHPDRIAQGRKYYERLVGQHSDDWVRRYVHAEYGNDPSGQAVFKESFRPKTPNGDPFHVTSGLEPVQGHPLIVGQDFGRNPWSIICQLDHRGRLLVLEEVAAEDVGLELHINRGLRPAVTASRYWGIPVAIVGDPAGVQRSTSYEETSFDVLKRAGFHCFPAPTNNIDPRLRAVEAFLEAQRDGGPAFLIDKDRCPMLTRALGGGYRFARLRSGQLKPAPDKNDYSHVADALQYAASAAHGGMTNMIQARIMRRPGRQRAQVTTAAWT
jgi:hypothetical protein